MRATAQKCKIVGKVDLSANTATLTVPKSRKKRKYVQKALTYRLSSILAPALREYRAKNSH